MLKCAIETAARKVATSAKSTGVCYSEKAAFYYIYNLIAVLSAIRARKFYTQEDTTLAKKDYSVRKWMVPKKRAESYAKDRKQKVHTYGPKEGQELTDYEAGLRSGYLLCQSDHAGIYKYKKARDEGKSKAEAKRISQKRGK